MPLDEGTPEAFSYFSMSYSWNFWRKIFALYLASAIYLLIPFIYNECFFVQSPPQSIFYVLLYFPLIILSRGSYYPHYLRMKVKLSKIRTFPKLILNIYLLICSSSHFRVAFCLLLGICHEWLRLTQRARLIRVLGEHGRTHNYILTIKHDW